MTQKGYFLYSFPTDGCHHKKGRECEYKNIGFDDAKVD